VLCIVLLNRKKCGLLQSKHLLDEDFCKLSEEEEGIPFRTEHGGDFTGGKSLANVFWGRRIAKLGLAFSIEKYIVRI